MVSFAQMGGQLARFDCKELPLDGMRPAAVLLPLFLRDDQPWLLFTRRTDHLPHHQGEISFPGGRAETADAHLWQTALRETEEEMGIRADHVTRLGQLDDFYSVHDFRVTPFVGWFPQPYPYRVDRGEIEQVIELPLLRLRDPAIYHQEDWRHKGRSLPVDFYSLDGRQIWGLTAAILKQFLGRIAPLFD